MTQGVARVMRAVVFGVAAMVCSVPAAAQSGALFLLLPFGARAVGLGDAVTADTAMGAEGVWWNPGVLARARSKEIAFHHSQTFLANSEMLTVVVPSRVIGTLGVAGYFVDYGDQQATDPNNNPTGVLRNRSYVVSASYATPVGKRLNVGLTYKWVALRFNDCSGACNGATVAAGSSSALDLGAQYDLPTPSPITLGVSVRNLGPKLQVKDQPQADPLPRLLQIGLSGHVPVSSLAASGAALTVNADVISSPALDGLGFGVGSALSYRDQYFLRAGYKALSGDASGPSIGIGFQSGAFGFDFARRFDRNGALFGETPTYITLRAKF
ncbi:MAG: PorV/PorQ family protein [Gemmatimonadaceae bacterium]|nr:PorV/PorQ family protein [Gemmatimonadaceae bacterium]